MRPRPRAGRVLGVAPPTPRPGAHGRHARAAAPEARCWGDGLAKEKGGGAHPRQRDQDTSSRQSAPHVKYLFPDTNVLLHYKHPSQLDWCKLAGDEEVTLVLTTNTVGEVDDKKNYSESARVKKLARIAYEWIAGVLDGKPNVPPRVSVELGMEPLDETFTKHRLDAGKPDQRHIAGMLSHREAENIKRLVVTADNGMKMSLLGRNLPWLVPGDEDRRPDDEDPAITALKKENAEIRRHLNPMPRLEVTFHDCASRLDVVVVVPRDPDEDVARLTQEANALERIESLGSKADREEQATYNRALAQFHLDEYAHRMLLLLVVPVTFALKNVGRRPAEDIFVSFKFPSGVRLVGHRPEVPPEPVRPKPPIPRAVRHVLALGHKFDRLVPGWTGAPEVYSPANPSSLVSLSDVGRIEGWDDEAREWRVSKLLHTRERRLEAFLVFDTLEDLRNFGFVAHIKSADLQEPAECDLHVLVKRMSGAKPAETDDLHDGDGG